ncbi:MULTISPECIES: GNAT family N-acetyltransferase [Cytobacillus]|uniref:GNAT family N-acetyltransferase n=1 Tax=Cytobacillus stercorigallinarum TaxID=2762240 RepID=A0ABR8QV41_9BACI|nr:GNAT family N-acetyltransferase [Cytobacillus stercorigallinarum]MBD7939312.1 GNAT family N-acetyltransferase [Cytobacillus stercorigallinarum]
MMKLIGSHIYLGSPQLQEFPCVWKMLNDKDARKYTGGIPQISYAERELLYAEQCQTFGENGNWEFSIYSRENNDYLGYAGFTFDDVTERYYLMYGLDRQYWGKGYATDAITLLLAFANKKLSISTIYASVHPENASSIHLLKKQSFIKRDNEDLYILSR